jgi:uncharacterized sulfatase
MSLDGTLKGELAGKTIRPGFHVLPGMGNALATETDDGVVLIDAGQAHVVAAMIESLRAATDAPLHAICYSHGHGGYNAGVERWLAHNAERGEPEPRRIAHANLLRRYARYRETLDLQLRMASVQFPGPQGIPIELMRRGFELFDPTETFDESMQVVSGSRPIEAHWAPSETDDALALWFPNEGLLYGGAATPGDTIPNIGTPLRTQRFSIRWADTLDRLRALEPAVLVTEFGPVIDDPAAIRERLARTAEALRWLREEVVRRMNQGMDEWEILADIEYPAGLFDAAWMEPTYGCADYIVRDLYREENGWWDRNPTTLHPAARSDAASAVLSAISDPKHVLARARALADGGDTQLALHVVDLLALASGDDPHVVEARALKAELCNARAKQIRPYVSKACYRSSARMLQAGSTSWRNLE